MESTNPLLEIILMIATAGAIYGAIRSDIKNIHERLVTIEKNMTRLIWSKRETDKLED